MSSTLDEYWDVDGTSLHTYATKIVNLGGPYTGAIPMRGANLAVPYRPGQIWRPKVPDARTLQLGFIVIGKSDEGAKVGDPIQQAGLNYRNLRALLWRDDGSQYSLTKRWRHAGALVSATALAAYAGGLDADMAGMPRSIVRTAVSLLLADPYFYSAATTTNVTTSGASVSNPGDAAAIGFGLTVKFNGPLTNPAVLNITLGLELALGTTIAGGDSITVDCDAYTVTRTSDSANLVGALTHSGARQWFGLARGSNSLDLTTDAGAGTVDVTFRAPYL
jgi:hypothetical protein